MVSVKLTSDHHLFHKNSRGTGIIDFCHRPFADLDEMHEHIIKEWNEAVTPEDVVIHLGDYICGGGFDEVKEITQQLNGHKILITGNHDRKGKQWFLNIGFERVFKRRLVMGMYCFSHHPQPAQWLLDNDVRYNMHGHTHRWQYGDPYYNFCVDVVGYKPKAVKLDLTREEILHGEDRCINNQNVDPKSG
jgi:calcineurin-like phosphoesterase family protein